MKKKDFFSELFRKQITVNDPDYWLMVYAEFLFRIDDLIDKNCTCIKCQADLQNYRDFFSRLKKERNSFYDQK